MIYGNISRALVYNTDSIIESIARDCNDFRMFFENDNILIEAGISDKLKAIIEKIKRFCKSIPGKLKILLSKIRKKFREFMERTKKKIKRPQNTENEHEKLISALRFKVYDYWNAAANTYYHSDAKHDWSLFIINSLTENDETESLNDTVVLKLKKIFTSDNKKICLFFDKEQTIQDMTNTIKTWPERIEKNGLELHGREIIKTFDDWVGFEENMECFLENTEDVIKNITNTLKQVLQACDKSDIVGGLEDSDPDYYNSLIRHFSNLGKITSDSIIFFNTYLSILTHIINKAVSQNNAMAAFWNSEMDRIFGDDWDDDDDFEDDEEE